MHTQALTKLYGLMSPAELARLAVNAPTVDARAEVVRHVPVDTWRIKHPAYLNTLTGIGQGCEYVALNLHHIRTAFYKSLADFLLNCLTQASTDSALRDLAWLNAALCEYDAQMPAWCERQAIDETNFRARHLLPAHAPLESFSTSTDEAAKTDAAAYVASVYAGADDLISQYVS